MMQINKSRNAWRVVVFILIALIVLMVFTLIYAWPAYVQSKELKKTMDFYTMFEDVALSDSGELSVKAISEGCTAYWCFDAYSKGYKTFNVDNGNNIQEEFDNQLSSLREFGCEIEIREKSSWEKSSKYEQYFILDCPGFEKQRQGAWNAGISINPDDNGVVETINIARH